MNNISFKDPVTEGAFKSQAIVADRSEVTWGTSTRYDLQYRFLSPILCPGGFGPALRHCDFIQMITTYCSAGNKVE